jgi:hypothetical protein
MLAGVTSWTPSTAIPAAKYLWWVRAKINNGLTGQWSAPKAFNNTGSPVLLTPAGTTTDRTPTFVWSAVNGAASYNFRIRRADTNIGVANVQNLNATSYTMPTNLQPGQYRIWVRAVSTGGAISNWSPSVVITVASQENSQDNEMSVLESNSLLLIPRPIESERDSKITASSAQMPVKSEAEAEPDNGVDLLSRKPESIDVVMSQWALDYDSLRGHD